MNSALHASPPASREHSPRDVVPVGSQPGSSGSRGAVAFSRVALAIAVAAMGVVDLLSALLSHPSDRLLALRHLVPTDVLDTSRTFTLLAGALLLVTAWGLRRGKRRAFVAALLLCAVSVPVNLLKAFDFEEATLASALMFALGVSAGAFRVGSRGLRFGRLRSGLAWGAVALAVYALLGTWVVEQQVGHRISLTRAFADAGYRMFGIGAPVELAPATMPDAQRRIAEWYARSLPVLSLALVLGAALAALRPASHRRRHRDERGHVARLLGAHGDSTIASFALEDDCDYFFSPNHRAVIAYRFESDTLLAIGDAIGPPEEHASLLAAFARMCEESDWTFAFFQARPEYLPTYESLGWTALHLGEDPILWTDRFTLDGPAAAEARRGVNKALRSGLEVRHFAPGESPLEPERRDHALVAELRSISHEWLASRAGGERGFCMGRFDPERLRESWLAVAWNPGSARVEGFVTWVPVWARRGWSLDLARRRSDSAPGTMELLVVRSVEAARARGDAMLSLALSALASADPEPAPAASDRARVFLRRHLARFYDFEGLFRWKSKFAPQFEDRYLVFPGPWALPRVALALVRAQSPGGLRAYARALLTPRGGPHRDEPHDA